ncbi:MAG: tetrathionate reductase family octaheme c-type cytochrome [Thiohalocapsa sp.]
MLDFRSSYKRNSASAVGRLGGLFGALALMVFCVSTAAADAVPAKADGVGPDQQASTADHSKFEQLQGPFATGPDVTKACLGCHTEAAKQVHKSIHWTWEYTNPETGQLLGKKHVVNNYCGSITTNYARCTSCHVGFGWKDDSFDFDSESNVDCMVCHDPTGEYIKFPTAAGHPPYEDTKFMGKEVKAPDLAKVAQQVGKTSRETCGNCHFTGGGGNGVKHGDLDKSLNQPPHALDVHMDKDGLNFTCSTCHEFTNHQQKGSRYLVTAKNEAGIAVPGRENARPSCESCHGLEPHDRAVDNKLNEHVDKIACETCHIPQFARGGMPTKTWWDWSKAGQKGPDGKPLVKKENGVVVYDGKKGEFIWAENVEPEYRWFDGKVRYTLLGEKIDPDGVVELNKIVGGPDDPDARIWPFKIMRGIQPYDSGNDILVVEHLFGKDDAAYWKSFDWGKSIASGMAEAKRVGQTDVAYSGEYAFTETEMAWPLAHMVAPADEALGCGDCHSRDGRMAQLTGFYLPGRDTNPLIDLVGWVLIAATLIGVLLHGLGRYIAARKRQA